jgi:hypothetical protein
MKDCSLPMLVMRLTLVTNALQLIDLSLWQQQQHWCEVAAADRHGEAQFAQLQCVHALALLPDTTRGIRVLASSLHSVAIPLMEHPLLSPC